MKSELRRFFNTYFGVAFCFMLGNALLAGIALLSDFIFGTFFIDNWYTKIGFFFQLLFGWLGVAWVIRDGEFIDHVKASHWSQKEKRS